MEQETPQKIEVTLEDVLHVTQKGFERVEKRMDEMEKKMDEMATKEELREMENRLTEKIDKVDSRLGGLTRRVEVLEDADRLIKTKIGI